jgi:hypothetical protein
VAVEVLSAMVVDPGGARVGVSRGELDVAQRDAGVERGHDESCAQHVRMYGSESGALSDRSHPSMRCAPIEPLTIAPQQDRPVIPLADREVNGPRRQRDEWDHGGLVSLTDDPQRSVSALEAEILDVGVACLADA